MKQPLIIAHRGASAYAPENTMSSFRKALFMGSDGIELDVQLTIDGHPVVIHDEKIDRTSNGSGFVKNLTFEELGRYDFGGWYSSEFTGEKISALSEVLELLSDKEMLLNIELKNNVVKYEGMEKTVINLIRKYGFEKKVILSSFNHYSMFEIKEIAPDLKVGLLYSHGIVFPWDYAARLNADAIHPLYYNINSELTELCKKNNIRINTYTVDDAELIMKFANLGVDGIITNVPDIALEVLKDFRKP